MDSCLAKPRRGLLPSQPATPALVSDGADSSDNVNRLCTRQAAEGVNVSRLKLVSVLTEKEAIHRYPSLILYHAARSHRNRLQRQRRARLTHLSSAAAYRLERPHRRAVRLAFDLEPIFAVLVGRAAVRRSGVTRRTHGVCSRIEHRGITERVGHGGIPTTAGQTAKISATRIRGLSVGARSIRDANTISVDQDLVTHLEQRRVALLD
jgi:hypothetical protein